MNHRTKALEGLMAMAWVLPLIGGFGCDSLIQEEGNAELQSMKASADSGWSAAVGRGHAETLEEAEALAKTVARAELLAQSGVNIEFTFDQFTQEVGDELKEKITQTYKSSVEGVLVGSRVTDRYLQEQTEEFRCWVEVSVQDQELERDIVTKRFLWSLYDEELTDSQACLFWSRYGDFFPNDIYGHYLRVKSAVEAGKLGDATRWCQELNSKLDGTKDRSAVRIVHPITRESIELDIEKLWNSIRFDWDTLMSELKTAGEQSSKAFYFRQYDQNQVVFKSDFDEGGLKSELICENARHICLWLIGPVGSGNSKVMLIRDHSALDYGARTFVGSVSPESERSAWLRLQDFSLAKGKYVLVAIGAESPGELEASLERVLEMRVPETFDDSVNSSASPLISEEEVRGGDLESQNAFGELNRVLRDGARIGALRVFEIR